ncbi:MAG: TIGR01777 family protein [Proteobacteria bacterium]|nr:TIGR01777 family protein [Pseudomonadota bacterium]
MKILLTGATGLIGKELGKHLVEHGHEVVSLVRDAARARLRVPYETSFVEWKGGDAAFPPEALAQLAGLDGVINLMGENLAIGRWTLALKERFVSSRVDGTRSLVKAVLSQGAPRFWIQGSAIGFYGVSPDGVVFDESSPRGKGFLADLCRDWEGATGEIPASVRKVVCRIGVVMSHQGGAFPRMLEPLLNGLGAVLGSGKQMMSTIHLRDVIRFLVHAVEQPQVEGIFNLVDEEPLPQGKVVDRICALMRVSRGPRVPAFALRMAFGEMASILLESQAVCSLRLKEAGFHLKYPRIEDTLAEVITWNLHPIHAHESVMVHFTEQFIPQELETVFPFFSDARNLETLTPEWLNFRIQKVSTESVQRGTRIRYRLKLHGMPLGWLTDIAEWEPPMRFVDNQLKGPYKLWYHEHTFHRVKGGTLIRDWIRFKLPMGKLGQWVGLRKIRSDVEKIFEHRRVKIHELFGSHRSG